MVCLGNICRSPLAQGLLESKVNESKVYTDSAGTAAYHVGNSPDERSIEVAKKHGIYINNQRARKFVIEDFEKFSIIYAMDESNYQNILKLARNKDDENKVKMILNEVYPSKNLSVPDPYYGNDGFQLVFDLLNDACTTIAKKIK